MSIELLSPAGGMEALRAAVQNGADAVYLGERSFSARKNAENFDDEGLKEAVKYSHTRGVKVYLAMNTLVKDREITAFEQGVNLAAESGVDALIIQDFGGAYIAKSVCPKMEIHASTQMSAHNEKDVLSLLERGFSRVVLARELKKQEIEKIYKNTGASLEVFVHGALCVCVSGQCLMSSFIGGRSGNRGECAQPCRQLYESSGKSGYFLSPKDICLLEDLSELERIGVDSLKIEGRMKRAEYVATVTGVYRKYLDNPGKIEKKDIDELKGIFVRGDDFTRGYFDNKNTPEIMNYHTSNDDISSKADKEVLKRAKMTYREGVENKKIPVSAFLSLKRGENAVLTLSDGENTAVIYGEKPQEAVNVPINEAAARERISKMGQTPYFVEQFDCEIDSSITMSAKDINTLRRDCTEKLSEMRTALGIPEIKEFEYDYKKSENKNVSIIASVLNEEQLEASEGADFVYMPLSLYEKVARLENYIPILPKVTYDVKRFTERLKKSGATRAVATTVGWIKALKDENIECIGDYGFNIFNSLSACEYKECGVKHLTLSPELNFGEIRDICKKTDADCEILAYGRMQMMTTRACIIKGIRGKCSCEKPLYLKDKKGANFFVSADTDEHLNMIYNTSPTFMADKIDLLKGTGCKYFRLVFTDEKADEVRKIIDMYKGERECEMPKSFTRGYFMNSKK